MSRPDEQASTNEFDAASTISAFVPLLILCLVMIAWFGFQAVQLRGERTAMNELMTNQDKQIEDARKLRDSLDAIARGTAKLADAGNPNARLIVDELKRRGITINLNPPAPASNAPPEVQHK